VLFAVQAQRSPRRDAPLDPAGQVTAVLGLGALSFGVISGGAAGFGRPPALVALTVAVCASVAFVIAESRAARPMVPLPLFRSGAVAACAAIGFSVNAAF
jgi:MFS transporter, DHA2 family, methylenomycin A resistance protein